MLGVSRRWRGVHIPRGGVQGAYIPGYTGRLVYTTVHREAGIHHGTQGGSYIQYSREAHTSSTVGRLTHPVQ